MNTLQKAWPSMLGAKSVTLVHGFFSDDFFDRFKDGQSPVFILEGRPGLESSKEAIRELIKRGITPTVIADNMAGFLFYKNAVKDVWLSSFESNEARGALCPVGSLILAVLTRHHGVPIYLSPTQQRRSIGDQSKLLLSFNGKKVAPSGTKAYVPTVEWVPSQYLIINKVEVGL